MPDAPEKPAATTRLDYDRGAGSYATARRLRLLTWLTALNTLMIAGLLVGPHLSPFFRQKWGQYQAARAQERERRRIAAFEQQCLAHALPPDKVVYEEDPAGAAKLLAVPNGGYEPVLNGYAPAAPRRTRRHRPGESELLPGYQPPVRAAVPDYVDSFLRFASQPVFGGGGGGSSGLFGDSGPFGFARPGNLFGGGGTGPGEPALLFLHERTTPGGERFLVDVWLQPGYQIGSNHTTTDAGTFEKYGMRKQRRLLARAWTVPPAPAQPQGVHAWTVELNLPDREVPELARVRVGGAAEEDGAGDGVDVAADDAGPSDAAPPAVPINYGNKLRFFAGQADPANASRFTIDYVVDGERGAIDGQLRDDGIVLRPRDGKTPGAGTLRATHKVGQGADEVWDLAARPAASQPSGPSRGGQSAPVQ